MFCAIVAGTAERSLVYEDERLIAFLDINPVNDGHVLVAPKAHLSGLADVSPDTVSAMAVLAQRLAGALRESGFRCEGVNLMYADGEAAGQDVFHSHLHVIPRYSGDSLRIDANWKSPSRSILDEQAGRIRKALRGPE